MGGRQAVDLVHRKAIKAADDPGQERTRLADEYERDSLSAETAARAGVIDEIVAPGHTRARLAAALKLLAGLERRSAVNRNIAL